jgi:hypothetical protein
MRESGLGPSRGCRQRHGRRDVRGAAGRLPVSRTDGRAVGDVEAGARGDRRVAAHWVAEVAATATLVPVATPVTNVSDGSTTCTAALVAPA